MRSKRIKPPEGGKGGQAVRLRFYAAVITGCLAEVLSVAGMWVWTSLDLLEVAVWAVVIYLAAMCAVLWVTEPRQDRARKHDTPQFYDLREGSDGRN